MSKSESAQHCMRRNAHGDLRAIAPATLPAFLGGITTVAGLPLFLAEPGVDASPKDCRFLCFWTCDMVRSGSPSSMAIQSGMSPAPFWQMCEAVGSIEWLNWGGWAVPNFRKELARCSNIKMGAL
jgi:hypothetical protein